MTVRWTRRATTQLLEAVVYLEEQRPGAGARFYDAVRSVLGQARAHPRAFPRVPHVADADVRRALVAQYQRWVIYEVMDSPPALVVLAVWSTRRRPLAWRR